MKEGLIQELKGQEQFFLKTISCLSEEDSGFTPKEEMFTVAQHIAHTAETIDWFFEGAFSEKGFDMNFENYADKMKIHTSLEEGVKYYKAAIERAIAKLNDLSNDELMAPITAQIMKGAPKSSIIGAIADHTAHHRGALSVYARLTGKVPAMPYGDM